MAKTGEQSTKQTQKEAGLTWLEVSKNTELEPVLVELEERTKGLNGMSAIYVQVEGKLGVLVKAARQMIKDLDSMVKKVADLEEANAQLVCLNDGLKAELQEKNEVIDQSAMDIVQPAVPDSVPSVFQPVIDTLLDLADLEKVNEETVQTEQTAEVPCEASDPAPTE